MSQGAASVKSEASQEVRGRAQARRQEKAAGENTEKEIARSSTGRSKPEKAKKKKQKRRREKQDVPLPGIKPGSPAAGRKKRPGAVTSLGSCSLSPCAYLFSTTQSLLFYGEKGELVGNRGMALL